MQDGPREETLSKEGALARARVGRKWQVEVICDALSEGI